MHTVEQLQLAIRFAETLGYRVREEWLGGIGGGSCRIGHQKHLFLDLALSPIEQLSQVLTALHEEPAIHIMNPPTEIQRLLGMRARAA